MWCRCIAQVRMFSSRAIVSANVAQECKTRYRPDYFVRDARSPAAQRVYYGGVPDVIEVAEYSYVETALIGLFRNQMAFSQYVFLPLISILRFTVSP